MLIGDPSIRIDSLRAGAAAFIDEPFESDQLDDTFERLESMTEAAARRIALVADEGEVNDQLRALLAGGDRVELELVGPTARSMRSASVRLTSAWCSWDASGPSRAGSSCSATWRPTRCSASAR